MEKRIVIDTCVFVSALLSSDGSSRKLLGQCLMNKYQPLMGTTLYNEYESLMKREVVFGDCVISSKERDELLDAFASVCEWVHVYYLWRPNLRDEGDNHIFELAIAGNAHAIITHNLKDFKNGQLLFPNTTILTPIQLLKGD